jgi:hypothetical protein
MTSADTPRYNGLFIHKVPSASTLFFLTTFGYTIQPPPPQQQPQPPRRSTTPPILVFNLMFISHSVFVVSGRYPRFPHFLNHEFHHPLRHHSPPFPVRIDTLRFGCALSWQCQSLLLCFMVGLFLLRIIMSAFYGFDDDDYALRCWVISGRVCGWLIGWSLEVRAKVDE